MLEKQITAKDLAEIISFTNTYENSGGKLENCLSNPTHILIHNEILKYSKEELEEANKKQNNKFKYGNLETIALQFRNPYIYIAFLKKGAFYKSLTKESQWILDTFKNPSLELYKFIYYIEESIYQKKTRNNFYSEEERNKSEYLWHLFFYLNNIEITERKEFLEKFIPQFGKKHQDFIINEIFESTMHTSFSLLQNIINCLQKNGINPFLKKNLNEFLPTEQSYHGGETKFFISSNCTPIIKKLLDLGFNFDDSKYSYYNKNLFLSVATSSRIDLVELIIPHLKNITPPNKKMEEQDQLFESLKTSAPFFYKFIKPHYQKLKIENAISTIPISKINKNKNKI